MDTLDRKILQALQLDARVGYHELAVRLDADPDDISQRIQQMEKKGIIVQYTTVVNDAEDEEDAHKIRALIEVKVRPEKRCGFESVAKRVCRFPQVVEHYLLSGTYDFLIVVEGKQLMEISSFVSDKLSSIDNIRSTVTHFILKKYKVNGVILDKAPVDDRLLVSP